MLIAYTLIIIMLTKSSIRRMRVLFFFALRDRIPPPTVWDEGGRSNETERLPSKQRRQTTMTN